MDREQEKISRFMNDTLLQKTVYGIMLKTFLEPQKGDVQILAASRIAIDLLQKAWKDMEKYKTIKDEEVRNVGQVGL
jgi:hypothetical protein